MSNEKAIAERVATTLEGVPFYECSGCDFTTNDETKLDEIQDLIQRVDSGGIMPGGECPNCGCLVYLSNKHHEPYQLEVFAEILADNGWKVERS